MRLSIPAEVVWKSAAVPPCCDWLVLRSLHPSPTGKSCLPQLRFETELHCAQITRLAHFPGSSAILAGTDKGSLQAGHATGKARMDCRKSEASSGELEHAWRTLLQIHGMLFTFSSQLFSLDFPQPCFWGWFQPEILAGLHVSSQRQSAQELWVAFARSFLHWPLCLSGWPLPCHRWRGLGFARREFLDRQIAS